MGLAPPIVRLAVDTLIRVAAYWHYNVQEYFFVILIFFGAGHALHCSEDHELVLEGEGGPLLDHFFKRVRHDCNQHV